MDSSFTKAVVEVPKLSGFDKSHQNLLTGKVGTLIPILVDELIPGSKVNLKIAASACLPPLASDTFMRVSLKMEAFAVPMRLLFGSFESFFTNTPRKSVSQDSDGTHGINPSQGFLPYIHWPSGVGSSVIGGAGSLSDYLGMKGLVPTGASSEVDFTPIFHLAYHKIWDDWYRSPLIQETIFAYPEFMAGNLGKPPVYLWPHWFFGSDSSSQKMFAIDSDATKLVFPDGVNLFELRQRNFGYDYFTTATPTPQQGSAQTVSFDTSGSSGEFSIASLRAANSLQQFAERNQLAGTRFQDQIRARYGVNLSSGVAQRSILLGSAEFEVYTKGVFMTGQTSNAEPADVEVPNPFGSVASRYGSAYASGSNFIIKGFEAKEPCVLMVIASLVPRVTYSSGIHRRFMHYLGNPSSITQMANPILQNVGPQPIYRRELLGNRGTESAIFGYTDRYAEFKTMEDELHGLVRDGQTLEAFALQRTFTNTSTVISSSFLEIPTDYMDQVTALSGWLSDYGFWADFYFDYKLAMPLAKYSLPSLQDPAYEHGKSVVVNKGGDYLN